MTAIWLDESASIIFYHNLFLFRHFYEKTHTSYGYAEKNIGEDKELKFVLVRGKEAVIGGRNSRDVTNFSNYQEMLPLINNYFPKLDNSKLEHALKYFEERSVTKN